MGLHKDDLNFINERTAAEALGIPLEQHWILWAVLCFFAAALFWASIAQVDEVTSGVGKVIPSSNIQVVQNLEGGIVKEILIKEGDVVNKNQILMTIDDTRFNSSFRESSVQQSALQAKILRLEAEVSGQPLVFDYEFSNNNANYVRDETALYQSRAKEQSVGVSILQDDIIQKQQELKSAQSKLEQAQRSYDLVNKELNLTKPLVKQGAVSEVEVLRLERTVNDLKGSIDGVNLDIPRLQSELDSAKRKIEESHAKFITSATGDLNTARADYERILEGGKALEDRVNRTTVRSPVRGTVNKIDVRTIGGIIQPGADLIEIVPLEDTLLIEARLKPQDIGGLSPGLKAKVKITAYDFSIYGGLDAQVEQIGADTIKDERGESYYAIKVRTDKNYLLGKTGEELPIIPGMQATVDIITGHKTILDYIMKPFLKARYNALREK